MQTREWTDNINGMVYDFRQREQLASNAWKWLLTS